MITKSHGIYLPPRKKKVRNKSITIRFVLTGTIPSKKNRQIATMNWIGIVRAIKAIVMKKSKMAAFFDIIAVFKKNKPFIRPADEFKVWNEKAKAVIIEQAQTNKQYFKKFDLSYPIQESSISIYHYWKTNAIRDNSNKAETIHDLLVECGIIAGDNWQCLSPNKADADLYRGDLLDHITVIDLTAYKW